MFEHPAPWFEEVRELTERLVRVRSVSPGAGEQDVAREVLAILTEDGRSTAYTAAGLDPIPNDPWGRSNAYAYLRGASEKTVILFGHIDTVGTADYGSLEPFALSPDDLLRGFEAGVSPDGFFDRDMAEYPGDWLFGRGVVDMKSGVAVNLAVMRHMAAQAHTSPSPLSVIVLATVDEENESAGALRAAEFLLEMRTRHGLQYVGAVNTDYTTSLYPDDPHRYVYTGSIGKLLPSFYIVGRESHVGDPFAGIDANVILAELVRTCALDTDLCDVVGKDVAPPPVTLHAQDLKAQYDVQLPFEAWVYINLLTLTSTPADVLARLCQNAQDALATVLDRIAAAERRWSVTGGQNRREARVTQTGTVIAYADLLQRAQAAAGPHEVESALAQVWQQTLTTADSRTRSLALVRRLWSLSGLSGPAIVVYFSPPFYPHVATPESPLLDAMRTVIRAHPDLHLIEERYFPFLSDMSYVRLDVDDSLDALVDNMPVWLDDGHPSRPGGYSLPFAALRELDLPVINFGPYGRGAHQRGERVLMSYTFETLPRLVLEVMANL